MTTRRGFLKSLGILAATACIPEPLEKAVEFVEKKSAIPPEMKAMLEFKNQRHMMTIQRKTVTVTGSAQSEVLWYKFEGPEAEGFMPEDAMIKDRRHRIITWRNAGEDVVPELKKAI